MVPTQRPSIVLVSKRCWKVSKGNLLVRVDHDGLKELAGPVERRLVNGRLHSRTTIF